MRRSSILMLTALLAVLAAPGCKLVKNEDRATQTASAASGKDKLAAMVDEMWDAQVLPHLEQVATPLGALASAIAADLDKAGAEHGYRQKSEGSPWNFATTVSGVIVAANTESRAATAGVDIDADGAADATLQLGPVIRGTTLRDVLPFIDFTAFRDQIEFAQLSRAFNIKAYETALESLPRDALVGARVEALGVFTMRGKGDKVLVTPVRIRLEPAK